MGYNRSDLRVKFLGLKPALFGLSFVVFAALVSVVTVQDAAADVFTSTSYEIDASVSGSFGGQTSSTSYKMVSSGGESIIGNGSGGSYKLGQGYVAQLDKSLQLVMQPGGLAAYYVFDEGAGTAAWDSSLQSNTGSILNAPAWVAGKLGTALDFNGTTQRVSTAHTAQNNLETLTFSVWIKTAQTPASEASIIEKWAGSGAYPYVLRLQPDGRVQLASYNGTTYKYVNSTNALNDNAWHLVTGVRQLGGDMRLLVDGQQNSQVADWPTSQTTNTAGVFIGARSDGTRAFNGQIDEVKLFNRALTDAEIKAEYDAQNVGIPSGLSLSVITPGASQTAEFDTVIQTDAPGYSLAINQDHNLQFGVNTIPAVSGSIASPVTWVEGTTKGLGFTLYSTNATAIPGIWGGGAAYAAIPGASTGFYTRTGYTSGGKDILNLRLRSDVATTQPSGFYSNAVTVAGTMTP